jgi:hypothetical protein
VLYCAFKLQLADVVVFVVLFALILVFVTPQYYSDKTNATDNVQLYPLRVALLNLEYELKVTNLGTLALIPVLQKLPHLSEKAMSAARRDLLRQALEIALQPLREASHTGMRLTLADGSAFTGYPRNLSYVADDPEQSAEGGLRGGNTKRPCSRCLKDCDNLDDLNSHALERTLEVYDEVMALMRAAPNAKKKEEVGKEWGFYDEQPGLLGFAGERTPACECGCQRVAYN